MLVYSGRSSVITRVLGNGESQDQRDGGVTCHGLASLH